MCQFLVYMDRFVSDYVHVLCYVYVVFRLAHLIVDILAGGTMQQT